MDGNEEMVPGKDTILGSGKRTLSSQDNDSKVKCKKQRLAWKTQDKEAIKSYFVNYIKNKKALGKSECQTFIKLYKIDRECKHIKYYVKKSLLRAQSKLI